MNLDSPIAYVVGMLASYLLGSIPFGLLISKAKGVDVREHGSKNIGATNVGRTLGRRYGIATFFLDAGKGFVPVLLAGIAMGSLNRPDMPPQELLLWLSFGVASFLGHLYPVWLNFNGGKGVATGFGAILAVYPFLSLAAVGAIIVWVGCALITRYAGLSSCVSAITLPGFTLLVAPVAKFLGIFPQIPGDSGGWAPWAIVWPYFTLAAFLTVFVVWRHKSNLARMRAGTEPRIGSGKKVIGRPAAG